MPRNNDLFPCVIAADHECVKKALAAGADVNMRDGDTGTTPLMMAVNASSPELVHFLVKHRADVNAIAGDGSTPLSLATGEGNQQMVALLKELGAK